MRVVRKKGSILVLGLLLSILVGMQGAYAAIQMPEKVRIGLFYENTAVSVLSVSAVKGMQLGFVKDNNFSLIAEENSTNSIVIRKDAYYTKNGTTYTECNFSASSAVPAETVGPFHVQIGGDLADLNAVNQKVQEIKQKGIGAYPVYVDAWQVWAGFYVDQNTAQNDITANFITKLGSGDYKVVQPSPNRIVTVGANGETFFIFGSDISSFKINPKVDNNPYILNVNNKNYRGELEVKRLNGSDMTVVNVLSLDQYLYGVVPSEIESYSHAEALKAQAVAARTYTLNNMGKHNKHGFDLCTTTSCQVYKGFNGEAQSTNSAVDESKGKVVTYNGKPAQVFYFAASGGRTEDVRNVWGSTIPYLKSVEDKYEKKNREWEVNLTTSKIREILTGKGFDPGEILSMIIIKTAESGRVTELAIKGTNGERLYKLQDARFVFNLNSQWYTISSDAGVFVGQKGVNAIKMQVAGKKVRTASGISTLSASSYATVLGADNQKKNVPIVPTSYKLNGKGWGHGIGFSQEGAKGMADAGFKYDQILTHYLPGTIVE